MTDHIPTTQTVVAKLRRLAKKRALETSSPLHQCLESVAQESGYQHWKHLLRCREKTAVDSPSTIATSDINRGEGAPFPEIMPQDLALIGLGQEHLRRVKLSLSGLAAHGLAPVIENPLKGDVFIDVTIEGHRFQGAINSAPYVVLKSKNGVWAGGGCDLGEASIAYVKADRFKESKNHWAVCKYENQPRIDLTDLSSAGRRTLATEFGLPILTPDIILGEGKLFFYGSKAYAALVAWAKAHPRKIKQFRENSYLGHWSMAATLDAAL